MPEQKQGQQEQHEGGYGDDAGDQTQKGGSNAAGRENPVTDPVDADEALGNRTGGYGGNPASEDAPASAPKAPRD